MAFGSSNGEFGFGLSAFQRVAEINCHIGRISAAIWIGSTDGEWRRNMTVNAPMVGGSLVNTFLTVASDTQTTLTMGTGETDDGEVIFVNQIDTENQPLALEVVQYQSTQLPASPSRITIEIDDHCPLGSSSTVEKAHVDNLGRVHVAGSSSRSPTAFVSGRKFNWLMQFSVSDSGSVSSIRCGTADFATYSFGSTSFFTTNKIEAFEFSGQSVYLLSTFTTASQGASAADLSTARLQRFRSTDLTQDLSFLPTIATAAGNTTPMHRGRSLLFDARPTVARLLIAGDRDFQGTDEDPFLVRMIAAPMFANGFE